MASVSHTMTEYSKRPDGPLYKDCQDKLQDSCIVRTADYSVSSVYQCNLLYLLQHRQIQDSHISGGYRETLPLPCIPLTPGTFYRNICLYASNTHIYSQQVIHISSMKKHPKLECIV